jgi:hypothetical protein
LKDNNETKSPLNDTLNDQKSERIARALDKTSKLNSSFNPNLTRIIDNADSGREFVLDQADIKLSLIDPINHLKIHFTFQLLKKR